MSNRRLTQHRQQRDTATRDSGELKKENQKLKRQVARLRKQVERLEETPDDNVDDTEQTPDNAPKCPKCGSSKLGQIATPNGKKVTACRDCKKWRSRAT